jgi:uncharacterized protein YfiM (DUF2279 family)
VRAPAAPISFQAASGVATSTTSNSQRTKSGAGAGGAYQKSRGWTRTRRGRSPGTTSSRWCGPSTGAQCVKWGVEWNGASLSSAKYVNGTPEWISSRSNPVSSSARAVVAARAATWAE